MRRTTPAAIAALIALPLTVCAPALAQDASNGTSSESDGDTQQMSENPLIATVGDAEIRASDVSEVIGLLPQEMQQRPPDQLIPFAVQQLVMRELVLQTVRAEGTADGDTEPQPEGDPDDSATADSGDDAQSGEDSGATRTDNEIIRDFVDGRLEGVVTEERVQAAYDEAVESAEAASDTAETDVPPLEAVRPQIERQVRQRAIRDMRDELMEDIEVVFYGPDGEPRDVGTGEDTDGG